jgi:hypothetical protein
MIQIRFSCGHQQPHDNNLTDTMPACMICGDQHVARVKAPRPNFVGHACGPCAEYKALPAIAVTFDK